MQPGDTFLRTDSDRHLWVIRSDPDQDGDNVLLVNLTTWNEKKERACLLNRGDHPWITHETCVNYDDRDTVITTLAKLQDAKDGGALQFQASMSPAVLRRILDGAASSTRLTLEKAELLEKQGLIVI